jgi:uncharacterized protein with GYD domain
MPSKLRNRSVRVHLAVSAELENGQAHVDTRQCAAGVLGFILGSNSKVVFSQESKLQTIERGPEMQTFIMLTRLSHAALQSPSSLENLEREVMERIEAECPEVEWLSSYAVLGPSDYLDIFMAPDNEAATKVATVVRTFGHAETEVWGATEWKKFKELVRYLPPATT